LARWEKLEHEVVATEAMLKTNIFERKFANVILAQAPDQSVVGMALFFHNFSTFEARPGIYLEDLIVVPEVRFCCAAHSTILLRGGSCNG